MSIHETWANPFSSVGLGLLGWKWGLWSSHPASFPRFGEDPKPTRERELRDESPGQEKPLPLWFCARTGLGAGEGRGWQPWAQAVPWAGTG